MNNSFGKRTNNNVRDQLRGDPKNSSDEGSQRSSRKNNTFGKGGKYSEPIILSANTQSQLQNMIEQGYDVDNLARRVTLQR